MFRHYPKSEKVALFVTIAANVPPEPWTITADNTSAKSSNWTVDVLNKLASELEVPEETVQAYLPIAAKDHGDYESEKQQMLAPFISLIENSKTSAAQQYAQLLLFLIQHSRYDGRGRVLMRNILQCFKMTSTQGIAIEHIAAACLHEIQDEIIRKQEQRNDPRRKAFRYAKIGVAAAGAGVAIAFTAGLAAPAIAGALILMGGASAGAAAVVSTTSMMLLFGGAGAGLTGYRMTRRTRGLQEFEFEQYDQQGKGMAVMIMVSGWMDDDEDYKRSFGVFPYNLSPRERLSRLYQRYAPDRVSSVDKDLAGVTESNQEQFFSQLSKELGCSDPMSPDTFIPEYPTPPTEGPLLDAVNEALKQLTHASNSSSKTTTSSRIMSKFSLSSVTGVFSSRKNQPDTPEETPTQHEENSTTAYPPSASSALASSDNVAADIVSEVSAADAAADTTGTAAGATAAAAVVVNTNHAANCANDAATGPADTIEAADRKTDTEVEVEVSPLKDSMQYWHWRELDICPLYELTLLRWDTQLQKDLGNSIMKMLRDLGMSSVKQVLSMTLLAGLVAASALPLALLSMTKYIDGLWTIAVERADEAGKELAKALIARPEGSRPVTLVGYSVGARVIFSCLKELARLAQVHHDDAPPEGSGKESPRETDGNVTESSRGSNSTMEQLVGSSVEPGSAPSSSSGSSSSSSSSGISATVNAVDDSNFPPKIASAHKIDETEADARSTDETEVEVESQKTISAFDMRRMVQDVVLLGLPIKVNTSFWPLIRQVVGGRLINGYSTKDMVLGLIYRYERFQTSVSGITAVNVSGVEDVDLSDIVEMHVDYGRKMKAILQHIDLGSRTAHVASDDVDRQPQQD